MFPSLYFPSYVNPWGYFPTLDGIYHNLIANIFLDNYLFAPCFNPWSHPTSFYLPSLWRYSAGPNLAAFNFSMQDAAFSAEYWTDLNKTMSDSYYRGLLTASS